MTEPNPLHLPLPPDNVEEALRMKAIREAHWRNSQWRMQDTLDFGALAIRMFITRALDPRWTPRDSFAAAPEAPQERPRFAFVRPIALPPRAPTEK